VGGKTEKEFVRPQVKRHSKEVAGHHHIVVVSPIKGRELDGLIKHAGGWKAVSEHHITRTFTFPDFKTALEFTNKVGAIAEQQGHHPDIFLSWGKVEVTLHTHKIDGLTENDFILAARINKL
jgi:4a-hydroxytetrahydrobiopterin dehydratase